MQGKAGWGEGGCEAKGRKTEKLKTGEEVVAKKREGGRG